MPHTLHRWTIAIVVTALAIGGNPPPAVAHTMSAFGGYTQAADTACFSPWAGAMANVCSDTRALYEPLIIDAAGNLTVVVFAYGASTSNNVGCAAWGVSSDLTSFWGGVTTYLSVFGATTSISLSTFVPEWGTAFVKCLVNPGGRVNLVSW